MLIACQECHKQYDVGSLAVGSHIRCHCGDLCTVPEPQQRTARMLHCSSCGGRLVQGSNDCSFCGSQVALAERGLGHACPECFASLVRDAQFCSSCGVSIDPIEAGTLPVTGACPRCEGTLGRRDLATGIIFTECTSCGGIWLDEETFERTAKQRDVIPVALMPHRPTTQEPTILDSDVSYLPCPVCHDLMHRKNFLDNSGIIIDWCRGHGYWFDADELARVLDFIQDGGAADVRPIPMVPIPSQSDRHRPEVSSTSPAPLAASHSSPGDERQSRRRPTSSLEHLLDVLANCITSIFRA